MTDFREEKNCISMHWQLLILEVDSRLPNLLNFSWTSLHFPLYSRDEEEKRSTEWVKRIPEVVSALNSEVTGLAGKKPVEAIEEKVVDVKSSTTYLRPVGRNSDKPFKFIGEKERDSTLQRIWDIPLPPVSWKVVKGEPQIQCGLWMSSISSDHLWIKESQFSTIWKMVQSMVSL